MSETTSEKKFGSLWLILLVAGVLILFTVASPFVFKGNEEATSVFGLLLVFVTTLVSVLATRHYATLSYQETLTRYGLQAWRNLESLSLKIQKTLNGGSVDDYRLEEWLLDVDQAKQGWRDLLQRVFALQERLERESNEIAVKYQRQLESAQSDEERSRIEMLKEKELAERSAQAPLPMRMPVKVKCPKCDEEMSTLLGTNISDTRWLDCPNCNLHYPIHRTRDGSAKIGGTRGISLTEKRSINCPGCSTLNEIDNKNTAGIVQCISCSTHILYSGSDENSITEDLGITNATISCPYCTEGQEIWINPTKSVQFLVACRECSQAIQVEGTNMNFTVAKREVNDETPAPPA